MCLLQAALRVSRHVGCAGISTQSNGSHRATRDASMSRESPRQPCVRRSGGIEKQMEKEISQGEKDRKREDIEYYMEENETGVETE